MTIKWTRGKHQTAECPQTYYKSDCGGYTIWREDGTGGPLWTLVYPDNRHVPYSTLRSAKEYAQGHRDGLYPHQYYWRCCDQQGAAWCLREAQRGLEEHEQKSHKGKPIGTFGVKFAPTSSPK